MTFSDARRMSDGRLRYYFYRLGYIRISPTMSGFGAWLLNGSYLEVYDCRLFI